MRPFSPDLEDKRHTGHQYHLLEIWRDAIFRYRGWVCKDRQVWSDDYESNGLEEALADLRAAHDAYWASF